MKKTMRRLIVIFCVLSIVFSGCGKNKSGDGADTAGKGTEHDGADLGEKQTAEVIDVTDPDMIPVYAENISDGTYKITVDSSSSMFRVTDCTLVVADGKMSATMTMSGTGYLYVYMGDCVEAEAADESTYIGFEELPTGEHTFTVPVEALNKGISVAAFSKNKQTWYDRTLVFRADLLPQDAYTSDIVKKPEDVFAEEGTYTAEVSVKGGSGKASVESPAVIVYRDGAATATVVWNSPNYDYMVVDGEKYEPVNTDGNSTFEIPVTCFDFGMQVSADTTAMSTPHEIDYTLTFDSASVRKAEE